MRRLVSLLSVLALVVTFGVACSDPISPDLTSSQDALPIGSNNDALPIGSNN